MRILFIGNFLTSSGGTIGISEELIDHLIPCGFEVTKTSEKRNKFLRWLDMSLMIVRGNYDVAAIDVYSGQALYWAFTSCVLLSNRRIPYILTLHGGGLVSFAPKVSWLVDWMFKRAAWIHTPSMHLKKYFEQYTDGIHYLPNGIDLTNYQPKTLRRQLKKLIWLRSIHSIYAPWIAVESVKILRHEGFDVLLEMVGPDKHDGSMERVRSLIHAYGLDEAVKLTGGIPKGEVPEKLSEGDLFLNTTLFESFGVSVMEAAACGLPIVTTNVGELKFMWEDGVDALLVPPNDAQAMANAVKRLLTELGLGEKLSTNARKKAETFDWTVVLPQWVSLLEEVAKK